MRIQRTLKSMEPGETLELLSTDRISWWELPTCLGVNGHSLLEREQTGRLWWRSYRYLIGRASVPSNGG